MISRLAFLLAGLVLCLGASQVVAEVVVVVSRESDVIELDRAMIERIYLGRLQRLPGGQMAEPLDLPEGSPERIEFYAGLLNMSESQVRAHWARLIFTGRGRPPRILTDSEAVLRWLSRNPGSIGYVDSTLVDDRVRVVYAPDMSGEATAAERPLSTTGISSES